MNENDPKWFSYINPKHFLGEKPHMSSSRDLMLDVLDELESDTPASRIPSMPRFDELIGGFRDHEFSVFCGATGAGKTTFLANLSASFIEQKIPHFVAPVETGPKDFIKRTLSAMLKIDINQGRKITESAARLLQERYALKMAEAKKWLSLYENRFTVEQLMNDIAYTVKEHGVKIAMIDNLNFFLEVKRSNDLIVEMDRVVHELIIFCKQVPVHLVMVMHPKKTDTANPRVNSEFDVKGSSTAVQEAQNVFLWNRLTEDQLKDSRLSEMDRELKIAKLRRIGSAVGSRVIFTPTQGVHYREKAIVRQGLTVFV